MMVQDRGLIIQPVLLAYTHNNDTMITSQKTIDITDFPSKFTHTKVDSTSKDNWPSIQIEPA